MIKSIIILLLTMSPAIVIPLAQVTVNPIATNPDTLLTITKLSTLGIPTPTNLTCFFPLVINLNITWTGQAFYSVTVSGFTILSNTKNKVVSNSTSDTVQYPNNIIPVIQVFHDIPIIFRVSFPRTCILNLSTTQLIYTDGTYSFQFSLP